MTHQALLGINWTLSSFHGWGILGVNLALALLRAGRLPVPLAETSLSLGEDDWRRIAPALEAGEEIRKLITPGQRFQLGFPVLQPVGNAMRWDEAILGTPDLGVTFFENTHLDKDACLRGQSLGKLITGSKWADAILTDLGFSNTALRYQGIDPSLYFPSPSRQKEKTGRFVVFSGGKLEFRKGQDVALEGFKRFHAKHPDSLLLTAWQNPWPGSAANIARGRYAASAPEAGDGVPLDVEGWVAAHGLPKSAHQEIGFVAHGLLPDLMRRADVALMTSRAESGTNLVAMEALALGLPTILSANTGHLDLIETIPCLPLRRQMSVTPLSAEDGVLGWGESDPDEIAELLGQAYDRRDAMSELGKRATEAMQDWTWEKRMDQMIGALELA
ncbi:hypothetical protein MTBLM1_50105 [Rhodospirillaceae bacterium LM-1]|nr:hypothetical protein MTBLM1_50105 [Rhodospirillaceae bacterium LM-1]